MRILTEAEFTDQCAVVEEVADELPALYHEVLDLHHALARDGFPTRSGANEGGGATNVVFDFECLDCGGTGKGEPAPMDSIVPPCPECGGEGTVKLTVPQHSDPVGEQVASDASEPWAAAMNQAAGAVRSARLAQSQAVEALNDAAKRIQRARKGVESARGALDRARRPPKGPPAEPLSDHWCWNCGRYVDDDGDQLMEPTYRHGPDLGDGSPVRPQSRHCYDWTIAAKLIRAGEHPTIAQNPAWPLWMPEVLVRLRHEGGRVYDADVHDAVDGSPEALARIANRHRRAVEATR